MFQEASNRGSGFVLKSILDSMGSSVLFSDALDSCLVVVQNIKTDKVFQEIQPGSEV